MAKKNKEDLIVIENRNKLSGATVTKEVFIHLGLLILVLIWIFPLVWIFLNSFRGRVSPTDPNEILPANVGYFATLFPEHWTIKNYTEMFEPAQMQIFNFPRMFLNTFFIAIIVCAISTTFVISVSYALSRIRFKTRQSLIQGSMIIGLFPGFMSMVAVYQILKAIGLLEGDFVYVGLILIYSAGSGAGFLLLKGYMDSIPRDLDEAATIDGATQWQIFTKVIIPISKPMIVYLIITSFLGPWLDFISARVITGAQSKYWTVSVGLYNMLNREYINTWFANFMAGGVMVAVPIGILTIIMQRYYNQSVAGAVKG